MARRRGRPDSLHWNASGALDEGKRAELAVLAAERAIPPGWAMRARLTELLDGAAGLSMEGEMLASALRRLPRSAELAQVEYRAASVRAAIADRVLLAGEDRDQVAADYQTNRATVDAIVAAAQAELRRNSA